LDIGTWERKEAGAVGARSTHLRIEGSGEEFSRGGAFYGEAWAIEEDFLGGQCTPGKVEGAFESAGATDEGATEKDDDACVGDNKSCVVAFEGPAGGGGADKIETEKNEPKVEPGGTVDVSAGDAGAEA